MALHLNTNAAYKDFQMLSRDKYFVDKSAIIEKINERVKTKNRFLCVTRPRRFGKTSALNMFDEYTMLNDSFFDEYFGFTEKEVRSLCGRQSRLVLEEIAEWYNGYTTEDMLSLRADEAEAATYYS